MFTGQKCSRDYKINVIENIVHIAQKMFTNPKKKVHGPKNIHVV